MTKVTGITQILSLLVQSSVAALLLASAIHGVRSYLDGRLDSHPTRNPYHYAAGIHRGGESGASAFTVGAVSLPDIRLGHPRFDPSTTMGNTFAGLIGGLAVFSRALSDDEIARMHLATAGS